MSELARLVTEKSLRRPDFARLTAGELKPGELDAIQAALDALKAAMGGSDREALQARTEALNHATQHLAEVMMNNSVRAALAGRNVKDV